MSILSWRTPLQLLEKVATAAGQDCILCASTADESVVCAACDARLPRCVSVSLESLGAVRAFDDAVATFDYAFPIDRLVQRFKFGGDLAVGRWLARQLARDVSALQPPALLVAPPLTAGRLRERGFNQAIEIAKVAARATGAHVVLDALVKLRETTPQPALGAGARRVNLRGAFACRLALSGESVAIVDDVFTTGATADAVAIALKEAGAGPVSVWTVARAPGPRR
jgi:ComF family protein